MASSKAGVAHHRLDDVSDGKKEVNSYAVGGTVAGTKSFHHTSILK
jgi:hypothetical protein